MFKKDKADAKVQETKLPEQKTEAKPTAPAVSEKPTAPAKEAKQGLSQREAVFNTVMSFFNKANVKFTGGKAADLITAEMRKQIVDAIAADFKANKVSLRESPANQEKLADEKLMRVYVSGLLNNWLRRDPRLNGTGNSK